MKSTAGRLSRRQLNMKVPGKIYSIVSTLAVIFGITANARDVEIFGHAMCQSSSYRH